MELIVIRRKGALLKLYLLYHCCTTAVPLLPLNPFCKGRFIHLYIAAVEAVMILLTIIP